jgi:hypothetical protein
MELVTVLVTHLQPSSNNISLAFDDALDASLTALPPTSKPPFPRTSVYS